MWPKKSVCVSQTTNLPSFCTELSGRQLSFARSALGAQTTDRRRQQQQQCRERATTSWLQFYTTCCIPHSCFYRTLGSAFEDRAGTCELLRSTSTAVCSGLLCVCNRHNSAVLLLCCPAAIGSGSSSKTVVPLEQYVPSWCCRRLPMMAYMCNAHGYCYLRCVVELNGKLSSTSISIQPYHTRLSCSRYQVSHGAKNLSYEYNHLSPTRYHIHVYIWKIKHGTRYEVYQACFQTFVIDREHSNAHKLVGSPLFCAE